MLSSSLNQGGWLVCVVSGPVHFKNQQRYLDLLQARQTLVPDCLLSVARTQQESMPPKQAPALCQRVCGYLGIKARSGFPDWSCQLKDHANEWTETEKAATKLHPAVGQRNAWAPRWVQGVQFRHMVVN